VSNHLHRNEDQSAEGEHRRELALRLLPPGLPWALFSLTWKSVENTSSGVPREGYFYWPFQSHCVQFQPTGSASFFLRELAIHRELTAATLHGVADPRLLLVKEKANSVKNPKRTYCLHS